MTSGLDHCCYILPTLTEKTKEFHSFALEAQLVVQSQHNQIWKGINLEVVGSDPTEVYLIPYLALRRKILSCVQH